MDRKINEIDNSETEDFKQKVEKLTARVDKFEMVLKTINGKL